ncbi:PHO85 cyclin-9 [Purpureocillium lavendulum]|uniref:PHO85 cyclin-9 n=1 Tax=Purpureocillium lavendulum TaxID=1247861 RepID=A0AB34FC31_9HYPO|nr:PHO85 cyclin-9 [Purpureocillium lavendulum]
MSRQHPCTDALNRAALEQFFRQAVNREMIAFLAGAAQTVVTHPAVMFPTSPDIHNLLLPSPRGVESPSLRSVGGGLPTLEAFIAQLVIASNVQVPTLMSTIIFMARLKAKLRPTAQGLRCTPHRIFLASLIIAGKLLNDDSPTNRYWARYFSINTGKHTFGFNCTEVNLMEKQLLFLLNWKLRITEQDLWRELDVFLKPIRVRMVNEAPQKEAYAAAERFPGNMIWSLGTLLSCDGCSKRLRHPSRG